MEGFVNMGNFTTMKDLFNINKAMVVEGLTNVELDSQCAIIKSEMLSSIEIPEEQIKFSCRLSDDEEQLLIITSVFPLDGEELPPELVEKVKRGLPVTSFEKVEIVEDKEDKEDSPLIDNKIMIVFIVVLIVLAMLYGYFKFG